MSRNLSVTLSEDDLRPLVFRDRVTGNSSILSMDNNKIVPESLHFTNEEHKPRKNVPDTKKDMNKEKLEDTIRRTLLTEQKTQWGSRQYRRYSDKQYFRWDLDSERERKPSGIHDSFDGGYVNTEADECELCSLANKSFKEKAVQRTRRSTISKYCVELRKFEVE